MADLADASKRSLSFSRSPSGSYVKRRRSWQGIASTVKVAPAESGSFKRNTGRHGLYQKNSSSSSFQLLFSIILVLLGLSLLALLVLLIVFVCINPDYSYAEWNHVRDQAIVIIHRGDIQWALILLAAFIGALLLIIASYALMTFLISRHTERGKSRVQAGLDDLSTSDLEQGDAHLKTGRRIAELMSDAEKRYVAEYGKKASLQTAEAREGQSLPAGIGHSQLSLERLPEHEAGPAAGSGPPVRSWSIRGILPFQRRTSVDAGAPTARSTSADTLPRSPSWVANSTEVAAHLSSPDAFNRAASPYVQGPALMEGEGSEDTQGSPKGASEEDDPETPSTPTMGELMRRQREAYELETGADGVAGSPLRTGSTRIVVRRPLETDDEDSGGSESNDDDIYSRGGQAKRHLCADPAAKQNSKRAHIAAPMPNTADSLPMGSIGDTLSDTSNGWQDVGLESDHDESPKGAREGRTTALSSGHLLAAHTAKPHSGTSPETLTIELVPVEILTDQQGPVQLMVCLTLEEVLPRPQTGLLHRMLRLAGVKRIEMHGVDKPVFVLHPGTEYMIGVRVLQSANECQKMPFGVKWLRLKPADGQEARFPVEQESGQHIGWFGTAAWDTALHDSALLNGSETSAEAKALPVELTIGLESTGSALTRIEGTFQLCVYLDTRNTASRLTTSLPGSEYVENTIVQQCVREMGMPATSSNVASLVLCVL